MKSKDLLSKFYKKKKIEPLSKSVLFSKKSSLDRKPTIIYEVNQDLDIDILKFILKHTKQVGRYINGRHLVVNYILLSDLLSLNITYPNILYSYKNIRKLKLSNPNPEAASVTTDEAEIILTTLITELELKESLTTEEANNLIKKIERKINE